MELGEVTELDKETELGEDVKLGEVEAFLGHKARQGYGAR